MLKVIEDRSSEYYDYLDSHIGGVRDAWTYVLRPQLIDSKYADKIDFELVDDLVRNHDSSKYDKEEFYPYLNYFYPTTDNPKDESTFNKAWLIHAHKNPHHHQHWVLIRDDGDLIAIDMPIEYVCEMVCDWHSFSRKDPESTAYKWYQDNSSKMTLSDATIDILNDLVELLKNPLEASYDD